MIDRLTVEDVTLERGGRPLFAGLRFELRAGEAAALTGANGAGKTSVLRAVAGLMRPQTGAIAFWRENGAVEAEAARSGGLHLLGHHDGLKPTRTAGEELAFWTRWLGGGAEAATRAVEALDLSPLLGLEVRQLSAGQRRRLALARLLAAPRALWLLDEPLAPLDAARRERFGLLMQRHLQQGGMVLAAVHDALPLPAREIRIGRA